MRRLAVHLFTLCSAASLLLCVATFALWVRSYRLTDVVDWRCSGGARWARSARGSVEFGLLLVDWSAYPAEFHAPRYQRDIARPPENYLNYLGGSWDDKDFNWEWHGFEWHHKRNRRLGVLHGLGVVPFWFVMIATATPPLGRMGLRWRSRVRARRRSSQGLCPSCGYDLRATPERCPECGAVPIAVHRDVPIRRA
jgi:hypothetical protein